jgi:hypothetical protein
MTFPPPSPTGECGDSLPLWWREVIGVSAMPRTQITPSGTKLWLSANDTYFWARRPGNSWPGSQLSSRRVFAEFDSRGDLVDMAVDGRSDVDVDGNEFTAICSDFLRAKDPNHPAIR